MTTIAIPENDYTIGHFIEKFGQIPDDRWTKYTTLDKKTNASCALGHCGMHNGKETDESRSLCNIFDGHYINIICVNDTASAGYPQATIKERILAALEDKRVKYEKSKSS